MTRWFVRIAEIAVAVVAVYVWSYLIDADPDDIAGWAALGVAVAASSAWRANNA